MKRGLANLLLLLAAFGFAALCAEGVVRVLMKAETPLFPRYHTDYRYGPYTIRGIRPNEEFWHSSADGRWRFVTNERGFRDQRNFDYAKPAATLRVLVLGDSHTQGYEVAQHETYAAVLERYLEHHGRRAEVINTGVSGFSNAEALAFLEHEGFAYQPDVVVLGFFENDVEDNFKAGLFDLDQDGELRAVRYSHIPGVRIQNLIYAIPGVQWLSENSYFYSLLFNTAWNVGKLIVMRIAARDAADPAAPAAADDFEFAIATAANVTGPQHALAVALIARMQQLCAERRVRLLVVDIPGYPAPYRSRPSMSDELLGDLTTAGVEVVSSAALFERLQGAAALHVLHGYNHISPLAHALIGVELGRRILAP